MLGYLPLIQQILSLSVGKRHSHVSGINLNVSGMASAVMALATAFAAIIFLMIGLQSWLSEAIQSPYAVPLSWLCCALIAFAGSGILVLVAKKSKKDHGIIGLAYSNATPSDTIGKSIPTDPASLIQNVQDEFAHKVEDNPLAAVLMAAMAGAVAGQKVHH